MKACVGSDRKYFEYKKDDHREESPLVDNLQCDLIDLT